MLSGYIITSNLFKKPRTKTKWYSVTCPNHDDLMYPCLLIFFVRPWHLASFLMSVCLSLFLSLLCDVHSSLHAWMKIIVSSVSVVVEDFHSSPNSISLSLSLCSMIIFHCSTFLFILRGRNKHAKKVMLLLLLFFFACPPFLPSLPLICSTDQGKIRDAFESLLHCHFMWETDVLLFCCNPNKGRHELPPRPPGGEEGRAGRAVEGVHQRVEEAEGQGGGGAQEAQGEAGQEEGDQVRRPSGFCIHTLVHK